jgi:Tol biopolymer transport system component
VCFAQTETLHANGAAFHARYSGIRSIRILPQSGARPRFSPDGKVIVFDRKNSDGFYGVYLSDLQGRMLGSVSQGRRGIPQRNNGNARFDPSGQHIVFISEVEKHFGTLIKSLGDPGVGLYSNLWATTPAGKQVRQLTDIPIKMHLADRTPSFATVNPLFTPDGKTLLWTERYDEGGHNKWGMWRIKAAQVSSEGAFSIERARVLITPSRGNYITATAFLDPDHLVVAGNLDGQHEYGMDQYVYDLATGRYTNLTNTPEAWDEDSCVTPDKHIIWMSNAQSRYKFDFSKDWTTQPVQRDYYVMDSDGRNKQRLTYFNDPSAPEYLGDRTLVAACDLSPDGRFLAGTIGIDHGTGDRRADVELKIVLIEFARPFAPGGSSDKQR